MAAPLSHAARRPRNPVIEAWFSLDDSDDVGIRRLFLEADEAVPIGRASKNPTKGIMAAEDNLYIDSPVVSRTHAELRARIGSNGPSLYVTDRNSMHGTHVDGVNLKAGVPTRLGPSARLRLGNDVVRDDGTFIAPTLKVSHLRDHSRRSLSSPPASFPRGITVPDATPSDSEAEVGDSGASEGSDDDISIATSEDDEHEYGDGYIVTSDDEEGDEADHGEETLANLDHSDTKKPEQQPEFSRPLLPTIPNMLSGTPPTSSNNGVEEEVAKLDRSRVIGASPSLSAASDIGDSEAYVTESEVEHSDEESAVDDSPCGSLGQTTTEDKQAGAEPSARRVNGASSKSMGPAFRVYYPQPDLGAHNSNPADVPGNTSIAGTWPSGIRSTAFPLEAPSLHQHFMDPLSTDFYAPYQDHMIWNSPEMAVAESVALPTKWDTFPTPPMTTPDKPVLDAAAQSGYLDRSNSPPPPSPPAAARTKTLSISELVDTAAKPAQLCSGIKRKAEVLDVDPSEQLAHSSSGIKRKADALEVEATSIMQSFFEPIIPLNADSAASPKPPAASSDVASLTSPKSSVTAVNAASQAIPVSPEAVTEQDPPEAPASTEDQQPPRKRVRRMLGFASTVAAGFAVGAIAVVGGLTALPEHFFE